MKYLTILLYFCFVTSLFAQDSLTINAAKTADTTDLTYKESILQEKKVPNGLDERMPWIIAAVMAFLAIWQFIRRNSVTKEKGFHGEKGRDDYKEAKSNSQAKDDLEQYKNFLKEKLGSIGILGSSQMSALQVDILKSFVSLNLSPSPLEQRTEEDRKISPSQANEPSQTSNLKIENVIKRVFSTERMLIIIGDAGSGKTTLLKYFAISCIKNHYQKFGFKKEPLPIFLPLREINFDSTDPDLCETLARYTNIPTSRISKKRFAGWLKRQNCILMLDGLDEIADEEKRRSACKWIGETAERITNAKFIVTTRRTGFDREKNIKITFPTIEAEVCGLSNEQQQDFLYQWFDAAATAGKIPPDEKDRGQWEKEERAKAKDQAEQVIAYLAKPENIRLNELAVNPMILQIVALLNHKKNYMAPNLAKLYAAAMHYLLEEREIEKKIPVKLDANGSMAVLKPMAMWMQKEKKSEEIDADTLYPFLQLLLNDYKQDASEFCTFLQERASLLEKSRNIYFFRHKSFLEYFAGGHIADMWQDKKFMRDVMSHFGEEWWKEPLRFFISGSDGQKFDAFIDALFSVLSQRELVQKEQNFLQQLIEEAPAKRINKLREKLLDRRIKQRTKLYIIESLKKIGGKDALDALDAYRKKYEKEEAGTKAEEVIKEFRSAKGMGIVTEKNGLAAQMVEIFKSLPNSFRCPVEEAAEYILIPGGTYTFTVTEKKVTVPNTYFAKYPVTNKRYNRFIAYLKGEADELNGALLLNSFIEQLLEFSKIEEGYKKYLGDDPKGWAQKLATKEDRKKFLGDDQPVIKVTWYDAMAYCLWLTLLGTASQKNKMNVTLNEATAHYRLPHEREWEWGAFGDPESRSFGTGSLREYPWPKDKGEPTPKLANYGNNVGATTPVGRYPDGATPQGLLDMAGNVWEWQSNNHDKPPTARSLRGGSWSDVDNSLRRPSRVNDFPDYNWLYVGFRVVFSESPVFDTLEI